MNSHLRVNLTSVRKPLNGYQKGKCFYCFKKISIESGQADTCDVDHFIPLSVQFTTSQELTLNDVWNLVLCCQDCNRGEPNGKYARIPQKRLLERLNKRNEYLIESNHPLKETIIMLTGKNENKRASFLSRIYQYATTVKPGEWESKEEFDIGF